MFFLSGPLLVTALVAGWGPASAVGCAAALVTVGTIGFVVAASPIAAAGDRSGNGALRVTAVRILVGSTTLQSITFGLLPVGLAAITADAGHPVLAGILQAALTAGGVVGAFGPAATASWIRYRRMVTGFALALVPVALLAVVGTTAGLAGIGVALAAAGLFLTPTAAATYLLTARATSSQHRTEAFTWLSTGQAIGTAAGSALGGVLVQAGGPAAALGLAPAAVAVAALTVRFRP